ncbi:MAG TPA: hypothetical protein VL325_08475, partial [Pyrinomonadaceae bacterium]|nr:hypothetical protein [Pyrinomonadaceae bacterium]
MVIANVTNAGIHENLSKGVINIKGIPTSCQTREGTTETNTHVSLCLHRAEIKNEIDTKKIDAITSMLKSLGIIASTL